MSNLDWKFRNMPKKRRSNKRDNNNPYQQFQNPAVTHNATIYNAGNYNPNVNPAGQSFEDYSRVSGGYSVAAKKQGMSKKKKAVMIVLISILVVLLGAGTAFGLYVMHLNDSLTKGNKSDDELMKINEALASYDTSLDDVFYMMLMGSDTRERSVEGYGRSDSNIIARVDPKQYKVTLLSIPRDTKIEIPGYGTQKFNAAYAFNGPAGAIEAAEDLLDIEITHYAEVSFDDLAHLVDAVGGVTVENESKIDNKKCDWDGNHYVIEEGTQHLGGGAALTFARNRDYPDGDFTRQKHQRMVIQAIVDEVLNAPITSMPGIIEAAVNCVVTDLNVMDIIGLAQNFANADELTMYSCMLPSYTKTIKGISFVICDEEKTAEMMKVFKAGEDPGDYVSTKTAADYKGDTDVSNVLLYDDDDEVRNGSASVTKPSYHPPSNSGNNGSSGNSGSSNTTTKPTDPTPSDPDPDSGGDSGNSGSGTGGGGSEGEGGGESNADA